MIKVNKDDCLRWLKIEPAGGLSKSCDKYRGRNELNVSAESQEIGNLYAARISLPQLSTVQEGFRVNFAW